MLDTVAHSEDEVEYQKYRCGALGLAPVVETAFCPPVMVPILPILPTTARGIKFDEKYFFPPHHKFLDNDKLQLENYLHH